MVRKVISGGQIGADIAGLRAARKLGIETGGYAARGFRTITGSNPELGSVYGLEDTDIVAYPYRTNLNVQLSDGTVRLAIDFRSAGERCTMKAIERHGKPYFDVIIDQLAMGLTMEPKARALRAWIRENGIEVLNVAGNAKQSIERAVEDYLFTALR